MTYPDTETYYVNWAGGSSGSFISTLIAKLIYQIDKPIELSEYGNAHANSEMIKSNWKYNYPASYTEPIYLRVSPINPTIPFLMYQEIFTDATPNWDTLFNIYPKCKNVIITLTKEDEPLRELNHYYKFLCDNDEFPEHFWNMVKRKVPEFKQFSNPKEAPVELIKKYINRPNFLPGVGPVSSRLHFSDSKIIPNKYKDNIVRIKFHDIIFNMKLVLETLGDVTKRPIPEIIKTEYQQYLAKQQILIDKFL